MNIGINEFQFPKTQNLKYERLAREAREALSFIILIFIYWNGGNIHGPSNINKLLSNVVKNDTIDLKNEKLCSQDVNILTYCIARSYITMNWELINLCDCKLKSVMKNAARYFKA